MIIKLKRAWALFKQTLSFRYTVRKNHGKIYKGVQVRIRGDFAVGNDIIIGAKGIDLFSRSQIITTSGSKLIIGNHAGMSSVSIFCKRFIEIGENVNIGAGTIILDSNFHSLDWNIRRDRLCDPNNAISKPIVIKDDAFIGTRCIILKGVTIGSRAIIGAGSVVVSDIPSDCIAGGNPCRVIRMISNT